MKRINATSAQHLIATHVRPRKAPFCSREAEIRPTTTACTYGYCWNSYEPRIKCSLRPEDPVFFPEKGKRPRTSLELPGPTRARGSTHCRHTFTLSPRVPFKAASMRCPHFLRERRERENERSLFFPNRRGPKRKQDIARLKI